MKALKGIIESIWAKEPTIVLGVLTAGVVFLAAKLGIVVPEQSVGDALAYIVPILLAALGIRSQVSPAK